MFGFTIHRIKKFIMKSMDFYENCVHYPQNLLHKPVYFDKGGNLIEKVATCYPDRTFNHDLWMELFVNPYQYRWLFKDPLQWDNVDKYWVRKHFDFVYDMPCMLGKLVEPSFPLTEHMSYLFM